MIIESRRGSDFECLNNSSESSMSGDSFHSFSRLSFDAVVEQPSSEKKSVDLMIKHHRSSDSAYSAIRAATIRRKASLNFRDFRLIRRIGSGDIGKVYLCQLKNDDSCFYAMKVVDKEVLVLKRRFTERRWRGRFSRCLTILSCLTFMPCLKLRNFHALEYSFVPVVTCILSGIRCLINASL